VNSPAPPSHLPLPARLLAAPFLLRHDPADAEEPDLESLEEDADAADLPVGEGGQRGAAPPPGGSGGQPPLTPEQQEAQVAAQRALIEHLLQTLSPDCAEELRTVLDTPPEQQTQDQLSDDCRASVQSTANAFRQQQQGGGAEGGDGQAESGEAQQQRAAPRKYERVKLPPKGSKKSGGGSKRSAGASGPSLWTRLSKVDWSEYSEVGKLLFVLLVLVTGFVLYAYAHFQVREMERVRPGPTRPPRTEQAARTAPPRPPPLLPRRSRRPRPPPSPARARARARDCAGEGGQADGP
jgi:hypothetical protein